MYQVIDTHTKLVISEHKTSRAARNKVDKLDNAYGGYRYFVKWPDMTKAMIPVK